MGCFKYHHHLIRVDLYIITEMQVPRVVSAVVPVKGNPCWASGAAVIHLHHPREIDAFASGVTFHQGQGLRVVLAT
jgi:hypothetical protein